MDEMKYCNDIIVRLEELLYHELSVMSHWKVELVGADFIQSCDINGDTVEDVVQNCIREIKDAGFVKDMSYAISGLGVKLELKIKGCRHLPKEVRLRQDGIKPYICPITNMVLDQLIERLNFETTFVADLHIDENSGECRVWCAIYEDEDKIGSVCNWHEES